MTEGSKKVACEVVDLAICELEAVLKLQLVPRSKGPRLVRPLQCD